MSGFSYTVTVEAACARVDLRGGLDITTGGEFLLALPELVGNHDEVVVNAAELTYLDSSGLSAFIAAHKRALARGGQLVLTGVPPFLSRILTVTGLTDILPVRS